jgi:hypothetical protein
MKHPFRDISPKRTCTKKMSDYRLYKNELAADFHNRCGYTDCTDVWFGGSRTFQIDHFKPWSKNKNLKTEYSNLVYCCSYVNRAKWNDDSPLYLDPCDTDYNKHFERDGLGMIVGKSKEAKYMVDHLHLNLLRYRIIWTLDQLAPRIDKLESIVDAHPEYNVTLLSLLRLHQKFEKALHNNQ